MSGFLILLLVGGIFAAGMAAVWAQQQQWKTQALTLADQLGLSVVGTDELVGTYDDVAIKIYSKDHGGSSSTDWWTYTRCQLNDGLPTGLVVANQGFFGHLADMFGAKDIQLGTTLDPELRINGSDEAGIRALLTDSEVHQAIHAILAVEGKLELSGESLLVKVRGRHTEHAVQRAREAVRLVHALAGAGRGAWLALAESYDLAIDDQATQLSGRIEGVDVMIELIPGLSRETRITAVLERPLPAGTRVRRKDGGRGGAGLGDPVLDAMVAARSDDPDALAGRLCRDDVRGPLLEVVHGHPGSELLADRVVLKAPGRLGRRLRASTLAVVALASALS